MWAWVRQRRLPRPSPASVARESGSRAALCFLGVQRVVLQSGVPGRVVPPQGKGKSGRTAAPRGVGLGGLHGCGVSGWMDASTGGSPTPSSN